MYRKLSVSNQNKDGEGDWQLIAEYDEISFTRSLVSAAHVGKISNDVSITVLRDQPKQSNSLVESTFLIKFLTTQQFEIIDLAKSQVLKYGQRHGDDGLKIGREGMKPISQQEGKLRLMGERSRRLRGPLRFLKRERVRGTR